MTRIAYASDDGLVYAIESEGGRPRPLTPRGMTSTWPTWSPNGESVAFSGLRSGMNGHAQLDLYVTDADSPDARAIYANQPGTDAIARKTPHYALWSPDSSKLSFIAQTWESGLTLIVSDVTGDGGTSGLVNGAPLYMSWSADSRFLLAHSERSHYLIEFGKGREARQMPGSSTGYMAPSWSPTGKEMALMRDSGGERQSLLVGNVDERSFRAVAEVVGRASLGWRPGGGYIGLARDLEAASGYYRGLWLVDVNSGSERRVIADPLLCFFWSPDGARVAYVTPSEDAEGSVKWAVASIDGGDEPRSLVDFRPTQEQLTAFMFFDQYCQSHSLWSPDSSRIVFSGVLGVEKVRAPLPEGDETGVFVVDADGTGEPRRIAQGSIGFWSPA